MNGESEIEWVPGAHPSPLGHIVKLGEADLAHALELLHQAYYALGRGFNDDGQWYGPTYQAIAEFLWPDAVDVASAPRAIDPPVKET